MLLSILEFLAINAQPLILFVCGCFALVALRLTWLIYSYERAGKSSKPVFNVFFLSMGVAMFFIGIVFAGSMGYVGLLTQRL